MPEPLTERQQEVLNIVRRAIEQNGVPPSLQEIKDCLGINSLRGVTDHLDALERKGWLCRTGAKGTARCWRLMVDEEEIVDAAEFVAPSVTLPLVGTIAAGVPISAIEHVEDHLAVPLDMVGKSTECFILRVKGDSMIGDGILDGDLAILQSQSTARSGDIVAAVLDEEATLKHFVKIGMRVELHPSNPAYDPIPFTQDNSRIVGKLVGLLRNYS
jgi:repressor LexA